MSQDRPSRAAPHLDRRTWALAALEAMAEGGVAAVAVEPVARRLGATKGSFYWHFKDRAALVEAALSLYEEEGTEAVIADVLAGPDDPRDRLDLLFSFVFERSASDRIHDAL